MKWDFKLGRKEVSYTIFEGVVAVKPDSGLKEVGGQLGLLGFGRRMRDFVEPEVEMAVSTPYRWMFARAGWQFVAARDEVASAAKTRSVPPGVQAIAPVVVSANGEPMIATDLITVQLPEDLSEQHALDLLAEDHLILVRRNRFAPNTFQVRVPPGPSLPEVISALQQNTDRYRFAEPDLLQVMAGRLAPTDPDYGQQWQHSNDGSNGGTANADIHSERAWDITRGIAPDRPVRVAVIDNGIEISHADLASGIKAGAYFVSNAAGGATFVKHHAGAGFPAGNHGTFCLGMAGARMNNNVGVCGSAPEADLVAIACLPDQVGTQTTLARGVAYAADPTKEDSQASSDDGADIISCSLGPATDWDMTSVLDLAIQFAAGSGRGGLGSVIFWAVSNSPVAVSRDEVCSHADVIAVGRSNRNDLQDGSAFGPKLEFLAPGRDVYSTVNGNGYDFDTGTSYATPLAAGVGALVLSRHPSWTRQQVRDRLRQSCDKVGPVMYDANGHHDQYGYGRLNAEAAVQ